MGGFCFFTRFLPLCFAALLPASESSVIKAAPQRVGAAGVFMLIEGGGYTMDFTAARAACLRLNVTMATRDQMERALQQGLQTCKYGWIAEQIAAVPRLTSDQKCGKGNTGVVTWSVSTEKKFGVFCFNASDFEGTAKTSGAAPRTSRAPAALTTLTQTPAAPATPVITAATAGRPVKAGSTEGSSLTSRSPGTSSSVASSSPRPPSTCVPTSPSDLVTSEPAVATFAFSTSEPALPGSETSAKPSLRAVLIILAVLCLILLLLVAAGAVWYHKLNSFAFWSPGRLRDDAETEMMKHADGGADLRRQRGEEEEEEDEENDEYEEPDRKYSSDITLCVSPGTTTNSPE